MFIKELLVGAVVNISSLVAAMAMAWTSPMIPLMSVASEENPLQTVPPLDTLAWISSILAIGAVIGPFPGAYLADKFGRKKTMLGNSIFFIVSYLLMAFYPVLESILVARLLQGFGVGVSMTVQTMYIGEIASSEIRGALGSFMNLFITLGFLFVNCIGPFFSFMTVQLIFMIFPCLFVLLFITMPESPFYLVAKNQKADAVKSLEFLRNKSKEELQEEIEMIEGILRDSKTQDGTKSELCKRGNLKALTICGVLLALQQLSGLSGINFYATTIFLESGSRIDANLAVIILCLVQMAAVGFSALVADRWGRKSLLLFSTFPSFVFLFIFAGYEFGVNNEIDWISSLYFLPLTSLLGYMISVSCGLGPIPWALTSELFAPNIKRFAMPLMTVVSWVATFLVTRFFQPISSAIGSEWLFAIFGTFAALAFVFTVVYVFETKGLSLREVQQKLHRIPSEELGQDFMVSLPLISNGQNLPRVVSQLELRTFQNK